MKFIKNTYSIESCRIPKAFDGFTITQISDLHSKKVNDNLYKLIDGDIVVFTGDIVDKSDNDTFYVIDTINKITKNIPAYYVTGNHEAANLRIYSLVERYAKNVHFLHNEEVFIKKGDAAIKIIGLDDLEFSYLTQSKLPELPDDRLQNFDMSDYTVALSHSPNNIETFAKYNPDLVLSGHTHGGQFRLPVIGAIYAPGQGLFPKYDKGYYHINDTDLVISGGIGCSRLPIRVNCPAEINNIVLHNISGTYNDKQ